MRVDWIQFKSFVDSRNVPVHEKELDDGNLLLEAFDGPLHRTCKLKSDTADMTTYVNDYQGAANPTLTDASGHPLGHTPVFSDKKTADGKSLFNRTEGIEFTLSVGDNTCEFPMPWPQAKFNGLEIINGETGDKVDLKVLDTAAGTYTTVPNYQLNQFGYSVNVKSEYYVRESRYDADLYQGMRIVLEYNSVSAKTLYVNYMIHEVK